MVYQSLISKIVLHTIRGATLVFGPPEQNIYSGGFPGGIKINKLHLKSRFPPRGAPSNAALGTIPSLYFTIMNQTMVHAFERERII